MSNIATHFDIEETLIEISDYKTRQLVATKYTKPNGGIPLADLSEEVKSEFATTFPSSSITSMAGYEMAESGDTIETTDTLLQALGKLEKKIQTLKDAVEENELLTASAMNDIRDKIEFAHNYAAHYLTIKSTSNNNTIGFKTTDGQYTPTISVSTDNGKTWTSKTAGTSGTVLATLNTGKKLLVKGSNLQYGDGSDYSFFTSAGGFNIEGNIMSLIYGDNFSGKTTLAQTYTFINLFNGCTHLESATHLVLPATTLSGHCYEGMFSGCTALYETPVLSATTLAQNCYSNMFGGCTSLTTAPELPATTLASSCYSSMFNGCTGLTVAPALPATTLAESCYGDMFNGCTGLTTAPVLSATTLAQSCYSGMFQGCTGLATAPTLPATTLAEQCYSTMFKGCVSLAEAPVLPATTLAVLCYDNMFEGCTCLITAPSILPATTLAGSCYFGMFKDCASLIIAPELPAATLTSSCYFGMFSGCTSLNYIKCLATDISASSCTDMWVSNVSPSGVFFQDPNMTDWTTGVNGIPTGWPLYNDGIVLSTSKVKYVDDGGTETVSFTSAEPWAATTASEWFTVSPNSGSYGESTITITASASEVGRTGSIIITNGTDTQTISVVQTPYAEQYLTLEIVSGGTLLWKSRSNATRTISYSKDDGNNWTDVTSSNAGVPINVETGDKLLLKGTNAGYATAKDTCSGFSGGTASYNVYGNIMSLIGGDNFSGLTELTTTWTFHNLFAASRAVSAKHLVLPPMTLTAHCYRALFSKCHELVEPPTLPALVMVDSCYRYMFEQCGFETPPELPSTTLAVSCYEGMFEACPQLTQSPLLPATTLAATCYKQMFMNCTHLAKIRCLATSISTGTPTTKWVLNVSATGMFVKDPNMSSWTTGENGIPTGWTTVDVSLFPPSITFDGFSEITLSCETSGAEIYYRLGSGAQYTLYTAPIIISADTVVTAYSAKDGDTSLTVTKSCVYVNDEPLAYSNRDLTDWEYSGNQITVPYSVNAINGHTSSYSKGTYNFTTSFPMKEAQPAYLWFQHADQSADIYVDNTLVGTHWGGYNSFFSDISQFVHSGTNNIKVALCNTTRNELAPYRGDFNFNATLGYAKLLTSPVLPATKYGYDGFHITSNVSATTATIKVMTTIPVGASVVCTIDDGTYHYTETKSSTGEEISFTTTISGSTLHLWNGTSDPHLYDVTLDIYHDGELYHTFTRPYGFRFYEYLINDTVKVGTASNPYTGFTLNGSPYLLRGVCLHNDIAGKANALTHEDIAHDFEVLHELGCNFIRLAHYPHPKEVYDWCDRLGIVVQTEVPWVNESSSGMPQNYYTRLEGQYDDMVNQHYNHPSIMFWGLANEITPSTVAFTKQKLEQYKARIKNLDNERMVGFVMSHSYNNPSAFGSPDLDWFGCNIYVGWYVDKTSNDPTGQLNTRVKNFIANANKPMAFSEYGCGGTQRCHSDDPWTTTTKGTNQPRHDIEYEMWLHEGHIAAIRNFPQLMFTAQWQMFDIAVSSRQEGYKVCLDGINVTDDNNLKFLNNKGLVERDHVTKKDVFYLYKAEWNNDPFVHICGKEYTKNAKRAIKCYTNDGNALTMYINGVSACTANVTNHIAVFPELMLKKNDVVTVSGSTSGDTMTFTDVATAPVAWSASAYTMTYGDTYNGPTLENPLNLSATYSSSDTSVATIDSNGAVTIASAGTTTISAEFAVTTDYPATTISFELTVTSTN